MGIRERRQREKEQRRDDIIEAASQVFFKKGLADATMDEIATQAELSKATLYLYFKNKEELFLTVLLIVVNVFCEAIEASQNSKNTVRENLHALGRAYLSFFHKYPAYYKLLNTLELTDEIVFTKYEISYDLVVANKRIWQLVCNPIAEGIKQGIFRADIDPLEVGMTLWMGSIGIINLMDQIKDSPYQKGKCNETHEYDMLIQIKNLNFTKMLDVLWEAVINHITVVQKNV
ncbi:MAG: TetR/AcrR family transcriptional regulator [Candidatus Cloacimonetes bacterium]|nr:TetR/AcrR family transcriptional regulator [Candidatus Cloacimonadota bacterium]